MTGSDQPAGNDPADGQGAGVQICASEAEFQAAARTWAPGLPFPVLAGPQLRRYQAILPRRELPAVWVDPRPGVVFSIGGDLSRAAGHLLAAATLRPHRHAVPAELRAILRTERSGVDQTPRAVVASPEELGAVGDWPGSRAIGIVTGRTPAALSCLIYRSLTVRPGFDDRTFVASHPLLPGAMNADAVSFVDLEYLRERRAALVVLSGQGRECCTSLLDGMICGRAEPAGGPLPVAAGERATPCTSGGGCFRTDLGVADLMPAAEVNAVLVLAHSCAAVSVGTNAYPASLSVSLGLLDGTAVAVIGILGVHVADTHVPGALQEALAEGLPLGQILPRLRRAAGDTDLTRFGLLGDPGQVLPAPGRPAALPAPDPERSRAVLARLAELNTVLARLEQLSWLDVWIPDEGVREMRARMRDLCQDPAEEHAAVRVAEMALNLDRLQLDVIHHLVERIHAAGWDAGWQSHGFRQIGSRPVTCPNCGQPRAAELVLEHPVEDSLRLRTRQCRRCGDIWWATTADQFPVEVAGPVDLRLRRDPRAEFRRELVNLTNRELRIAVGYAFRRRKNLGLPAGTAQAYVLPSGGRRLLAGSIDLVTGAPPADTHSMLVVVLSDGVLLTTMLMVELRDDDSPAPRVTAHPAA